MSEGGRSRAVRRAPASPGGLSPEFVETEAAFAALRPRIVRVGDVRSFENVVVPIPPGLDPEAFTTVIVWCERFGPVITAARYH